MKHYLDLPGLTFFYNQIKQRFALKADIGAPLIAKKHSEMTNQKKIYVYTGSEDGYTNGNWYYYDSGQWVSGGVYNAVAVETDKSLGLENLPADSKATGDAIAGLRAEMPELIEANHKMITSEDVINMWAE